MLINSLDNVQYNNKSVLDKLDEMPIKLYLTGSRYFNNYAEFPQVLPNLTDYDYFCQYSDSSIKTLLEWFPTAEYIAASTLNNKVGQYNDSNIIGVAFIKDKDIKVDIQFVKYLDLKIEVQKILAAMGDCYYAAKKSQKQWLWDQQYERICKERNIVIL